MPNPSFSESALIRVLSDSLNILENNEAYIINNVETMPMIINPTLTSLRVNFINNNIQ